MSTLLQVLSNDPEGGTPHELRQLLVEAELGTVGEEREQNPFEKKDVQELFQMALRGDIPRARALKQGEPEKLSPQHLQWVLMRSLGFKPGQIVSLERADGREVTLPRVSVILHHPDAQYILARLISYRAETTIEDSSDRLAASANEMVDILLHHARNVKKPELSARTAMEVLRMHREDKKAAGPEKPKDSQPDKAELSRVAAALELSNQLRARGYSRVELGAGSTGGGNAPAADGPGLPPSQAPVETSPRLDIIPRFPVEE